MCQMSKHHLAQPIPPTLLSLPKNTDTFKRGVDPSYPQRQQQQEQHPLSYPGYSYPGQVLSSNWLIWRQKRSKDKSNTSQYGKPETGNGRWHIDQRNHPPKIEQIQWACPATT